MFFDNDDLTLRLERKAEIHHITKINEIKANKYDLAKTNDLIESLNERVKHLSNVQNELAITLEPIKNSMNIFDEKTKKKLLQKVENIQQQSKIVNSWINDTNLNEKHHTVRKLKL